MAHIGLLIHDQRERAAQLAEDTKEWLAKRGHEVSMLPTDPRSEPCARYDGQYAYLDLALSLGGDGTMLRTIDLVSSSQVPVLGVNLGNLGYLTAVEPEYLRGALDRYLLGDYQVEARMTLDVILRDGADGLGGIGAAGEPILRRSALNDVVLQRLGGGHTVRAEVRVNGASFLTYEADSLIVATPTGSTAYNLSARGPIVSPRARVQIITPVAPHMLFDRSLVLDASDTIEISLHPERRADLVIDGWPSTVLSPGQTVQCCQGHHDALLVTFAGRDFHNILKRKFNLAGR